MPRMLTLTVTGLLLCTAALIYTLPARHADTPARGAHQTQPAGDSARRARSPSSVVRRSIGGVQLAVPHNWIPEAAEPGVAIWRAPSRSANVTVARAAGGSGISSQILADAANELARTLGNGRVEDVAASKNRGWFVVRGTIPNGVRARVTQTWTAAPADQGWVILSWVDTAKLRLPAQLRLQVPGGRR